MTVLPRLLLVADGFAGGAGERRAEHVRRATTEAVQAGLRWVQLRDNAAAPNAFATEAGPFIARLRDVAPEVQISVNTHLAVAEEHGLGLHVGWRGPTVAAARHRLIGSVLSAAVHTAAQARHATSADAVLFSPVFPTASKPGHPGTGIGALAACCEATDVPVFALGGVTPESVASCLGAGAHGVAVLSGILDAPDPARAATHYLDALSTAR